MKLTYVVERIIERLEKPSEHTVRAYRASAVRFTKMTGIRTVKDFAAATPKHLQDCLDTERASKRYRPATVRHAFTLGKQMARWLVREGHMEVTPFRDLERIRVGRNVPEWNVLGEGELERVLAALPKRSILRVVITWLVGMGLRAHELSKLTLGDLTREKSRWVIHFTGKGAKRVKMAVTPEARAALEAWWEEVRANKGLVPTLPEHALVGDLDGAPVDPSWMYKRISSHTQKVVGHKVTPHGLRATFVTRIAREKGLYAAQQLARHAHDSTTRRYIRGDVVLSEEDF